MCDMILKINVANTVWPVFCLLLSSVKSNYKWHPCRIQNEIDYTNFQFPHTPLSMIRHAQCVFLPCLDDDDAVWQCRWSIHPSIHPSLLPPSTTIAVVVHHHGYTAALALRACMYTWIDSRDRPLSVPLTSRSPTVTLTVTHTHAARSAPDPRMHPSSRQCYMWSSPSFLSSKQTRPSGE